MSRRRHRSEARLIGDSQQRSALLRAQGVARGGPYSLRPAVARREAALEKTTAQDRLLMQEVRALVGDVDAYSLQLKALGRLLEDSDAVVASYLRQFQVGRRNWIEVLNAQREKTQAAFSLRDLEAAVNVSKVRLLLLVGKINAESLDGLNE